MKRLSTARLKKLIKIFTKAILKLMSHDISAILKGLYKLVMRAQSGICSTIQKMRKFIFASIVKLNPFNTCPCDYKAMLLAMFTQTRRYQKSRWFWSSTILSWQ